VPCDATHQVLQSDVHGYASVVSDTALFVGVLAVAIAIHRVGPAWLRRAAWWLLVLGGVVSSLLFGYFHRTPDPAWAVGASQRVHIVSISAWLLCLGVFAARAGPRQVTDDPTESHATEL
jgi:hypothetical protein